MTNGIDVAIVVAGLVVILVLFLYGEWAKWDDERREDRQLKREALEFYEDFFGSSE